MRSAHTLSVAGVVKCRFPLPRAASAEREQLSALSISVPVSMQPTPGRDDPSLHVSFSSNRTSAPFAGAGKLRPVVLHHRRFDRIFYQSRTAARVAKNAPSSRGVSSCHSTRRYKSILLKNPTSRSLDQSVGVELIILGIKIVFGLQL